MIMVQQQCCGSQETTRASAGYCGQDKLMEGRREKDREGERHIVPFIWDCKHNASCIHWDNRVNHPWAIYFIRRTAKIADPQAHESCCELVDLKRLPFLNILNALFCAHNGKVKWLKEKSSR